MTIPIGVRHQLPLFCGSPYSDLGSTRALRIQLDAEVGYGRGWLRIPLLYEAAPEHAPRGGRRPA